ncbi:MAG: GNAT family N-acetyltransferase, partial [Chloroflexi bacterium]|nr:GNAT family N-acetyltransferase [Chloroflexota bacterium]
VRPARLEDVPTVVVMLNGALTSQSRAATYTVERYLREWQAPGFHLDEDTRLVFSPEGRPVGCAEVWTPADPPIHPWIWACVDPQWEGRGIGTAMMAWSLNRAMAALDRVPKGARVAPRAGTRPSHAASVALFRDFGFSLVRISWFMTIDLTAPPTTPAWPPGIRLQPYRRPQDLEPVYRCVRDSFRDHWASVEVPFEQGLELFRHSATVLHPVEPDLWFVAVDGDKIAGVSLCRRCSDDDPEMGWVDTLAVRREWRRKGLGLALLLHSFHALRESGARRAGGHVDAGNLTGATRLYRRAGVSISGESSLYELELQPGEELGTHE